MKELTNAAALDAILTLATSDQRWRSRNQLASEMGVSPAALSMASSGARGLSESMVDAICDVIPGCTREALVLPVRARPGDLEQARLLAEVRRLREQVLRGTDEIADAIRQRNGA